jgi:chorismate synthase
MSSLGKLFRVTTFGESHGIGVGCIIENVPPLLEISESDIQHQLDRRKPNQNSLLSPRNEPDIVQIYSGVQNGISLGTPVCLIVKNIDMKPGDYKKFIDLPRPGHADLTYITKYGLNSTSGGGRASARETVARVAAGALAEKYLRTKFGVEIVSWVKSVGMHEIPKEIENELIYDNKITKEEIDLRGTFSIFKKKENKLGEGDISSVYSTDKIEIIFNKYLKLLFILHNTDHEEIDLNSVEMKLDEENNFCKYILFKEDTYEFRENLNVRCPHPETAIKIINSIIKIKSEGDSIGGIVSCVIKNCPQSLGEPCFDKFEAELAKAMLSIPATKGFEIGSGFEGTKMK